MVHGNINILLTAVDKRKMQRVAELREGWHLKQGGSKYFTGSFGMRTVCFNSTILRKNVM